jgi:hypothetical protein
MPRQLSRRHVLAAGGAAAVTAVAGCASAGGGGGWDASDALAVADVHQYSAPNCSCCSRYADYLSSAVDGDFAETVPGDVDAVKRDQGVPPALEGCHTVDLDGEYVVEGHVPTAAIEKLLDDRPDVDGIAVPGMPAGTPGMGGERPDSLAVRAFADGEPDGVYVEL